MHIGDKHACWNDGVRRRILAAALGIEVRACKFAFVAFEFAGDVVFHRSGAAVTVAETGWNCVGDGEPVPAIGHPDGRELSRGARTVVQRRDKVGCPRPGGYVRGNRYRLEYGWSFRIDRYVRDQDSRPRESDQYVIDTERRVLVVGAVEDANVAQVPVVQTGTEPSVFRSVDIGNRCDRYPLVGVGAAGPGFLNGALGYRAPGLGVVPVPETEPPGPVGERGGLDRGHAVTVQVTGVACVLAVNIGCYQGIVDRPAFIRVILEPGGRPAGEILEETLPCLVFEVGLVELEHDEIAVRSAYGNGRPVELRGPRKGQVSCFALSPGVGHAVGMDA